MTVHFVFVNTCYRQIDGISMGSYLGIFLADLFFAKAENGPLKEVTDKLDSYFRYIDDAFVVESSRS